MQGLFISSTHDNPLRQVLLAPFYRCFHMKLRDVKYSAQGHTVNKESIRIRSQFYFTLKSVHYSFSPLEK